MRPKRLAILVVLAMSLATCFAAFVAILPGFFVLSPRFRRLPVILTEIPARTISDGIAWSATVHQRPLVWEIHARFGRTEEQSSPGASEFGADMLPPWTLFAERPEDVFLILETATSVVTEDRAFGWPRPMLAYRTVWEWDVASGSYKQRIVYGAEIRFTWGNGETPVWPTRILWLGFAINAASMLPFALLVVLAPSIFRTAARSLRKEYDRCGNCGYVRLAECQEWRCPECGSLEHVVPQLGWTSRFSVVSFLRQPRVVTRLVFVVAFAVVAAVVGVYLAQMIGPM